MIVQDVPAEIRPDPATLYEAAVSDRRAGQPERAVQRLRQVLAIRPDDVDARLQLGLALTDLGRLDEAAIHLRQVLDRTPDYVDAHLGLARIARARGDSGMAAGHLEEAARLDPARAASGSPAAEAGAYPGRIDLDVSRSRLGAGLPDWTEVRLALSRPISARWTIAGALEHTERFGRTDLYLEGQIARRWTGGEAWVAIGATPEADYRPRAALRAGGSVRLAPALSATLDGSVSRFAAGEVTSLQPGLAVDWPAGGLTLAGRWINVWDETGHRADGYAVSARWAANDRLALRIDHADAPETSEGVVVDVASVAVSAEWRLIDRLSVRLGLLDEDRGAYSREAITVGLGWRFR